MENISEILEFDKIKEQIIQYNINELSRKRLLSLEPFYFDEIIEEELSKTKEAYKLVNMGTLPSLARIKDLNENINKVSKGAVLSLEEIYDFAETLDCIVAIKDFLIKNKIFEDEYPFFYRYCISLDNLSNVSDQIKFCVSANYTIYDHASSKLKSIRASIAKIEGEIKEKLNTFLRTNSEKLQDNYIATRGTHFVIPVKAMYKNQVKGIVVDVSGSENTVFIEPYSVTESNIQLESLHYEEELEIIRIIKGLCDLIANNSEKLLLDMKLLEEISFMILKGTYGLAMGYEVASLSSGQEIKVKQGYHPLIEKEKVIANDFELGNNANNIIVISGPNAGGKTVALKTIALIVYMNQCGLPIPVKEATLGVFRSIFVDIGDEQSIINSLSGFTSHMKNVSEIINNMDSHSFIILDELGSKTDPSEGEALAKAIIDYINNSNALALITTHYLGIKDYANENSSITLASMSFDEDTLTPSYKLILNMVGRSYALEISKRLGLKDEIIEKARTYKANRSNDLENVIDELSVKLKKEDTYIETLKNKEAELNQKLKEIEEDKALLEKKLEKSLEEVEDKKEEMLEEAYEEINKIVENFKNETNKDGFKQHLKNNAVAALDKLSANEEFIEKTRNEEVKVGDFVFVNSFNAEGKVIKISGNKATVQTNRNVLQVPVTECSKTKEKVLTKQQKKQIKINSLEKMKASVPLSLNIIGMHVDEAIVAVTNYLDACILVNYHQVNIIHGYGTGALRNAVANYLKTSKYVEDFHLGGFSDGGSGQTVVILKKSR